MKVSNNFIKNNIKWYDRNVISVDRWFPSSKINIKNEGLKKQLGMSLPEVTLTECNALAPRGSKKKRKTIGYVICGEHPI